MKPFKFNGIKLTWASDPKLRAKINELNAEMQREQGVRMSLSDARSKVIESKAKIKLAR